MTAHPLATGAEIRYTGRGDGVVVLAIDGGTGRELPGTWSASVEYVVSRCAPRLPDLGWAEVRYRTRSWRAIGACIEDAAAAVDAVVTRGAREVVLLGYSMGAIVACAVAGHDRIRRIVALAAWLPERVDVRGVRGREVTVIHGSLDRSLPGIPGVHPDHSRRGLARLVEAGAHGTHTLVRGAVHPIALRAPWGGLVPMPRAAGWADAVTRTLSPLEQEQPAGARPAIET